MTQHNSFSPKGLSFKRFFTKNVESAFDAFEYELRTSVIRNPKGDVVFEMNNVEVPKGWSQVATDILAQKYFRKAGVPTPEGRETSIKQVVHRLANCWQRWGERFGYFASKEDAENFYHEACFMMLAQMAAPNSPQWFNTGLYESYGIAGPPQGHWYVDPETNEVVESQSAYERPQPHACFILSVNDDLVNEGGIMDLWVREARIFKYGSGVGTNFSNIRAEGEPLSGGGHSSGLMSFLKIGDRAAGAIKSGGTTRRAAKMVILDIDHPEIMAFINWKKDEEKKVAALIAAGYPADYEGEAYRTVSGQNSNNSVRIPNHFFEILEKDGEWHTYYRTSGKVAQTYKARELWNAIAEAAWACADPGVQFHTTINEWHTCPKDGEIRASNPCSEYMFLDNTACNLASLNLRKFFNDSTLEFDVEAFCHACRIWTVVLDISVQMAHYPSKEIARLSYDFRTLGLGYANLGSMLMVAGIPYDSPKANAICAAITAIMTGTAYATSAEMAAHLSPFPGYERNKEDMLRVLRNHRYAAYNADASAYEGLSIIPQGINEAECPKYLLKAACQAWDQALQLGTEYGYRNAQVTVLAPTGTIGLLMDCDTTGIEPDFALVKFKKLAGGGYFKIINQAIPLALHNLGYQSHEIEAIVKYAVGHATLKGAPYINPESLRAKGFLDKDLNNIEAQLPSAFELQHTFNVFTLGEDCLRRLGFTPDQYQNPNFSLLEALGFTPTQIAAANEYVTGTMTIEGAPYLKPEHYPVFDCANKCGLKGTRFIHPHGHIRMMAAAQPFISGAISKTINLPHEAAWQEIQECYMLAHKLSLKAISIYRDGSKLSQPLSTKSDTRKAGTLVLQTKNGKQKMEFTKEELLETIANMLAQSDDNDFKSSLRRVVNRRPLPAKRRGFTQKAKVGGQTLFLRTGEYEDGTLGEIFIDMHKEGATLRSMLNCFAIAISIGLQYGVPLEEFVDKFAFTRFEPSGPVDHENIKHATSIVDFIFRLLALEYLNREDFAHVARTKIENENTKPPKNKTSGEDSLPSTSSTSLQQNSNNNNAASIKPSNIFLERNGLNAPFSGITQSYLAAIAAQQQSLSLMGDAPSCNVCGHITIRSGTCYKCLNCGNSMGCS
ncbi:MAG: vitamin B12-dependent ribonucleotide reductase [Bacteroidia bacterium]|nr:vitamin B12-dependent ribonucleotide reductase [Bacteroidia bacterium]MDW8159252.1 vitamin B12-dependent ribonucleotide reductase [Bacteroidia bacterium]